MFDKKNGFDLVVFSLLLSLSMAGLFIFGLIDKLFFNGGEGKTPTFLFSLQMFFGIIFSVILIVIVPIQILYYGRKNRDNTKLQKATIKDFIGLLLEFAIQMLNRPNGFPFQS